MGGGRGETTMENGSYQNVLFITIIISEKNIPSSWCSQAETLFLINFYFFVLLNCTNIFFFENS